MMLLGFKKQFKEPILIGTKVFTMRKRRKVRPKIGETIHMYSGLRTKNTEFISNKERLISIQNVRITIQKWDNKFHSKHDIVKLREGYGYPHVNYSNGKGQVYTIMILVDGSYIGPNHLEDFVKLDGFEDITSWIDYWLAGKDRTGALMEMYHWTDLKY